MESAAKLNSADQSASNAGLDRPAPIRWAAAGLAGESRSCQVPVSCPIRSSNPPTAAFLDFEDSPPLQEGSRETASLGKYSSTAATLSSPVLVSTSSLLECFSLHRENISIRTLPSLHAACSEVRSQSTAAPAKEFTCSTAPTLHALSNPRLAPNVFFK